MGWNGLMRSSRLPVRPLSSVQFAPSCSAKTTELISAHTSRSLINCPYLKILQILVLRLHIWIDRDVVGGRRWMHADDRRGNAGSTYARCLHRQHARQVT
jgi:hypothetical protein